MRKAIFIDRDGTLNEMVYDDTHGILDSPRRPDQVRMIPGAGVFLRKVRDLGYLVIVVTNQPGIAKGTLTLQDLATVNDCLQKLLCEDGGGWDDLIYCPHHPGQALAGAAAVARECECRKPAPGMILSAARKWDVDLARSWMIGDGLNDVECGHAAGVGTVLITTLKVEQIQRFLSLEGRSPEIVAGDLATAYRKIMIAGQRDGWQPHS